METLSLFLSDAGNNEGSYPDSWPGMSPRCTPLSLYEEMQAAHTRLNEDIDKINMRVSRCAADRRNEEVNALGGIARC
jgi:hypothetical protein